MLIIYYNSLKEVGLDLALSFFRYQRFMHYYINDLVNKAATLLYSKKIGKIWGRLVISSSINLLYFLRVFWDLAKIFFWKGREGGGYPKKEKEKRVECVVALHYYYYASGHVICKTCKAEAKITSCKICKQTFVDAPNVVLEKLISMIALPCRFRATGCAQFIFPDKKIEHETLCPYRVMSCQYSVQGCIEEMIYKEISAHHRHCQFRPPKRTSVSSLARNESISSNHNSKN